MAPKKDAFNTLVQQVAAYDRAAAAFQGDAESEKAEKNCTKAFEAAREQARKSFSLRDLTARVAAAGTQNPAAADNTLCAVALVLIEQEAQGEEADYRALYDATRRFADGDGGKSAEALSAAFDVFTGIGEQCPALAPAIRADMENVYLKDKPDTVKEDARHVLSSLETFDGAPEKKNTTLLSRLAQRIADFAAAEKTSSEPWQDFFRKTVRGNVMAYKAENTPEENAAFLEVYAQIKAATDTLKEDASADAVKALKGPVAAALSAITRKNTVTGEKIAADMNACLEQDPRPFMSAMAHAVIRDVEKRTPTGVSKPDSERAYLTKKDRQKPSAPKIPEPA